MEQGWVTIAGGVVLSAVTYFLGTKQRRVTIQGTELDSVQKAVAIWRGLAENMSADMEKWKGIANKLQSELDDLHKIVDDQNHIIAKQNHIIDKLEKEVAKLSKLVKHEK